MKSSHLLVVLPLALASLGSQCGAKLPERELPAEGEGEGEGPAEGEGEGPAEGEGEGPAEGEGEGPAEGEGEGAPWCEDGCSDPLPIEIETELEGAPPGPLYLTFVWIDPWAGEEDQEGYGEHGEPPAPPPPFGPGLMEIELPGLTPEEPLLLEVPLPTPDDDAFVRPPDDEGQPAENVRAAVYVAVVFVDLDEDGVLTSADGPVGWAPTHLLGYLEGDLGPQMPSQYDQLVAGWNHLEMEDLSSDDNPEVVPWETEVPLAVTRWPRLELTVRGVVEVDNGAPWPDGVDELRVGLVSESPFEESRATVASTPVRVAGADSVPFELALPDLQGARWESLFQMHVPDGRGGGDEVMMPATTLAFVLFDDQDGNRALDRAAGDKCLAMGEGIFDLFAREAAPAHFYFGLSVGHHLVEPTPPGPNGQPEPPGFELLEDDFEVRIVWRGHEACGPGGPDSGLAECGTPNGMPQDRTRGDAVTLDGQVYYVGGTSSQADQAHKVLRMDPDRGFWDDQISPLEVARTDLGAAAVNGRLYAVGGNWGREQDVHAVYSLHPDDAGWAAEPDLPLGVSYVSSSTVGLGSRVFVVGGRAADAGDGNVDLNRIQMLETQPQEGGPFWAKSPRWNGQAVHSATAVVFEEDIWVFGGESGNRVHGGVYVYHAPPPGTPASAARVEGNNVGMWDDQARGEMPWPRAGAEAVVVGDTIWFFGGWDHPDGEANQEVLSYRPQDGMWEKLLPPPGSPLHRDAAVTAVEEATGVHVFVLGGSVPSDAQGGERTPLPDVSELCVPMQMVEPPR